MSIIQNLQISSSRPSITAISSSLLPAKLSELALTQLSSFVEGWTPVWLEAVLVGRAGDELAGCENCQPGLLSRIVRQQLASSLGGLMQVG